MITRLIAITLLTAMGGMALAEGTNAVSKMPKKTLTQEEKDRLRYQHTGGMIEKPDAVKGFVAIIDTQSLMSRSNIVAAVEQVGDDVKAFDIRIFRMPPAAPAELKGKCKADRAVIIVDNDTDPSLIAAPDDGWALCNVRPLAQSLKTPAVREKFLDARCRKQFLRAFVMACSGAASSYPNNIMDVSKVEDLDLRKEFVPFDKFQAMGRMLRQGGLRPRQFRPYIRACQEGWAPAPTNDVQKAIWDKVHAIPEKPMKIKYDPNKAKPQVK